MVPVTDSNCMAHSYYFRNPETIIDESRNINVMMETIQKQNKQKPSSLLKRAKQQFFAQKKINGKTKHNYIQCKENIPMIKPLPLFKNFVNQSKIRIPKLWKNDLKLKSSSKTSWVNVQNTETTRVTFFRTWQFNQRMTLAYNQSRFPIVGVLITQ